MQLTDFIPPAFTRMFHRRASEGLKQYSTFAEAAAEADTYEAPDIVELVLRKTEIYRGQLSEAKVPAIKNQQTLQNLFVLSHVHPEQSLNVLELGGACGASYFELAQLLPERIASWRIVETPAMAARARATISPGTLDFFDNLVAATAGMKSRDLLIAQGVLQYVPQPLDTFDQLLSLGFDFVYVARTVTFGNDVSGGQTIVFNSKSNLCEHGPGPAPAGTIDRPITTTCTLVDEELLNRHALSGYRQRFKFEEAQPQTIFIGKRVLKVKNIGFLLEKDS